DMQTGLLPAVEQSDALVGRVYRLLSAAKRLEVPIIATEHCADKIGTTTPMLAELVDTVVEKHHFDATREAAMLPSLPTGRHHVLVVGTEAHVCVLQTALGLAASGFTPGWWPMGSAHAGKVTVPPACKDGCKRAVILSRAKWQCLNGWGPPVTRHFATCSQLSKASMK